MVGWQSPAVVTASSSLCCERAARLQSETYSSLLHDLKKIKLLLLLGLPPFSDHFTLFCHGLKKSDANHHHCHSLTHSPGKQSISDYFWSSNGLQYSSDVFFRYLMVLMSWKIKSGSSLWQSNKPVTWWFTPEPVSARYLKLFLFIFALLFFFKLSQNWRHL